MMKFKGTMTGALLLGMLLLSGCLPSKGEPQPPQADFSFSPTSPKVEEEIVFDASASKDLDGKIISYVWNFGDSSPEETTQSAAMIHVYKQSGRYTVKLTVTDDQGLSSSVEKAIQVLEEKKEEPKRSLPAPGGSPAGLAWDGSAFWVVDAQDLKIYKVDQNTGNILGSIDSPAFIPEGLTWDGSRLWLVDVAEMKLLQLEPSTGKVLKSLNTPGTDPTGLSWDGSALWVADAGGLKIYKVSPVTGKVIDSFGAPGEFPQGLAWDGQFLWHSDAARLLIYKLDPNGGTVLGEYEPPGSDPVSLAWDGQSLWVADGAQKKLFQLDVRGL